MKIVVTNILIIHTYKHIDTYRHIHSYIYIYIYIYKYEITKCSWNKFKVFLNRHFLP